VRASGTATTVAIVLGLTTLAGCGKKGPPLAPLHLVPAAPIELTARRSGEDVELRFSLPTANVNGPGAIDLVRVEIYAITVAPGVTPPNRDLLTTARVVGTIEVRPAPVEGEAPSPTDKRPGPGERVTFVDELTPEKLKPVVLVQKPVAGALKPLAAGQKPVAAGETPGVAGQKPEAGAQAPGAAPQKPEAGGQKPEAGGQKPEAAGQKPEVGQKPEAGVTKPDPEVAATEAAPPPVPTGIATLPTRIYAIRGLSRSRRPGAASARVIVPLLASVAAPSAVAAKMPTEKAVVVEWTSLAPEPGMPPLSFNIYRREATGAPINSSPVGDATFEIGNVEYGKEQCFVVRTVQTFASVTLESDSSTPACVTPLDTFPPAPPKGLRAVAEDTAISLVWDQSSEADLGGYLVLRGEAPGGTLLPLTKQPIKDANYRDATVKPGVRYVYAVVAVDTATPMNSSAPSTREEVTAR
jgi:predicted small lipoprotein YifL